MMDDVLRMIEAAGYKADIDLDGDRIKKVYDGDAEAGRFVAGPGSLGKTGRWHSVYCEYDDEGLEELHIKRL